MFWPRDRKLPNNDLHTPHAQAYIERCTHFFTICPTVRHHDLPDVECDYGSWLSRGWCRLELFTLLLARYNRLPAIIVKGPETVPFMIAAQAVLSNLPGLGAFTCCARGHNINGVEIPCDKLKIGSVIRTMLTKRIQYHLGRGEVHEFRLWKAAQSVFLSGLPQGAELEQPQLAADFLREYKFEVATDLEGSGTGFTPLTMACISGNLSVARELIQGGGADVHARTRVVDMIFGFPRGCTALHCAAGLVRLNSMELVKLLISAGADPNDSRNPGGFTPLMAAAMFSNPEGIRALLSQTAGVKVDLELGMSANNATALALAAYGSTPEIVNLLLEAGADRTSFNDHGGGKMTDACQNPRATPAMLAALWNDGKIDLNLPMRPRNLKWRLIDKAFRFGLRSGLASKSEFVLGMAHSEGTTPLHWAAAQGHLSQVAWLLRHGAHLSLHAENKLGKTPIDLARIFGPHPEVEAVLGSAMLDRNFHSRFMLRRGSVELRELAAGGAESEDGDVGPTQVSEPTESTADPTAFPHFQAASLRHDNGDGWSSTPAIIIDDASQTRSDHQLAVTATPAPGASQDDPSPSTALVVFGASGGGGDEIFPQVIAGGAASASAASLAEVARLYERERAQLLEQLEQGRAREQERERFHLERERVLREEGHEREQERERFHQERERVLREECRDRERFYQEQMVALQANIYNIQ